MTATDREALAVVAARDEHRARRLIDLLETIAPGAARRTKDA